jgi:predicted acyltransferase
MSATAAIKSTGAPAPTPAPRVVSLDVFRGIVMTLMLAEAMHLPAMVKAFPGSAFWGLIGFHTSHVEWRGCSLHDLIQPGFSFLVGAAMPFSLAARRAKGQPFGRMFAHAAWRALILIALGVFLRSLGRPQTNFTFIDTLSQIGLGYVFLFLLAFLAVRYQLAALALILAGYWALFMLYPSPGSPWEKNMNAASAFDLWFLNLFPREQPFTGNSGGYATLNFIPTLGTMLIGLIAGEWLKTVRGEAAKLRGLAVAGAALIVAGLIWDWTGTCPIVKRIWTPSWTLFSGGWVLLILAGLYTITEWRGWRRWAYPLIVVGMNSIAVYVMSWTMDDFVAGALTRHIGGVFTAAGAYASMLRGFLVMLVFWLILHWMYRRKIFLRI